MIKEKNLTNLIMRHPTKTPAYFLFPGGLMYSAFSFEYFPLDGPVLGNLWSVPSNSDSNNGAFTPDGLETPDPIYNNTKVSLQH